MSRKCFSHIPSSFISIYMITAFFAISFISLLYLKYPQTYINHIDFRIIKLNTTTGATTTTELLFNDFTAPVVNESKEVVNSVEIPTTLPDFQESPTPVVNNLVPNPSVDNNLVPNPSVDELSSSSNGNGAVSPTTTKPYDDEEVKNRDQISPPKSEEETYKDYLSPILNNMIVSEVSEPDALVSESEEKQDETDEDEDVDEASVTSHDNISLPPRNSTREQRMEWIKQKIPESKILESTPRTRQFEQKMQEFVRDKRCRVNIFLTWISPTSLFGKREMFSLESVLKAHPHACVIIISRIMNTISGQQIIQPLLDRGHMILTVAPDFPLLFYGTPAYDWFERLKAGQVDPGEIAITQNLSNLLRLVVLYKYGGIYFDTDMIVLKDVSGLRNSIGIQVIDPVEKTWTSVNNAVLIFDKDHPLLLKFMEEFNSTFDGSTWGFNGPYMATRIIKQIVNDPIYQFNVMSPMAFYPVGWLDIQNFFRKPNVNESSWDRDMFKKVSRESYGVHLWNKCSRNLKIEKGSIIGKLISKHCIICENIYGS